MRGTSLVALMLAAISIMTSMFILSPPLRFVFEDLWDIYDDFQYL